MIDYLKPNYANRPGIARGITPYALDVKSLIAPDVAIITPYFNTGEIFFETVQSLLSQSFQNWEWIIVDDGSTDEASIQRLDQVGKMDSRIKTYHQSNSGPSAARNHAFAKSSARYVCILDSDDLLEPTYIEKCIWFLESNKEFGFCNSFSVVFGESEYLWQLGFERGREHLKANSGPPISVVRREVFAADGGFDESITFGHEDWAFWLARAKAGHWGFTIQEYLQWYRKNSGGRFEQIMRAGETNAQFEAAVALKFADLEQHFPAPVRRHPQPYECLDQSIEIENPLFKPENKRSFLFLIPWMVTGGADRVNLDLVEGLVAGGHHVSIGATLQADHRWSHEFSRFTSDIFILPNFLSPSDFPRFLVYLIRSRKIDTVLITGSTIGYQLLPYLRAMCPEVVFVDMSHVEELHWLNGGHPRFGAGYQDALDLNIVTTQHLADWMATRGADKERIRVMYTGIRRFRAQDRQHIENDLRRELNVPEGVPVIVFAGRMCDQKRPLLLADILTRLRDQGSSFHAVVIGDGELRTAYLAKIALGRMDTRVTSIPSVSHEKWLQILCIADVLLMPSQYEGISVALLEAMASGVVPVVARVGGQPEIVTGDVGFAIDPAADQVSSYADAIARVLGDDELSRRLSAACVDACSIRFSWEKMIERFLSIIESAHQWHLATPRVTLTPTLGLELASMAMEYRRLSEAVDWLWHRQSPGVTSANQSLTAEAKAMMNLAIKLSEARVFKIMLTNPVGRKLAAWIYRQTISRKSVTG